MTAIFKYMLDRLAEPSTWRGLSVLLTGFGVALRPEMQDAIISVGLSVAGLIGVFFKDKVKKETAQDVVKQ